MSKTDKDRPWEIRLDDDFRHMGVFHEHFVFDREEHRIVELDCDYGPLNNIEDFRRGPRPAHRCRNDVESWSRIYKLIKTSDKVRSEEKQWYREVRHAVNRQLHMAKRLGIDADPDIYADRWLPAHY